MNNALPVVRNLQEQELLLAFMEAEARPRHTMDFYQLDGYLRAICSEPGMVKPCEWMPLVFSDGQPGYREAEEEERVLAAIKNLYSFHMGQVLSDRCDLPCAPVYCHRREERVDLEQWARGFMQGYILRGDSWNKLYGAAPAADQQGFAEKFDLVLNVIAVVADVDLALQQGTSPNDLADIFASLPEVLISFGCIGRALSGDPSEKKSSLETP